MSILRRALHLERGSYNFYNHAAEQASHARGQSLFLSLAAQEARHLRLLLAEYRALEAGQGWLPYEAALQADFAMNPANPDLPGSEIMETVPLFTAKREISLSGDIAALKFGLATERTASELYVQAAGRADDPLARQVYEYLIEREKIHYDLLQRTLDYLIQHHAWWGDEPPFSTT